MQWQQHWKLGPAKKYIVRLTFYAQTMFPPIKIKYQVTERYSGVGQHKEGCECSTSGGKPFGPVNQNLEDHQHHSHTEMDVTVQKQLQM